MDHDIHGVRATVIDLGLSRMESDEDSGESVRWTPFDDEVFEGEGNSVKRHSYLQRLNVSLSRR